MKFAKLAIGIAAVALLMGSVGCAGSKALAIRPLETNLSTFNSIYFSTESSIVEDISQQMDELEIKVLEKLDKQGHFATAQLGTCSENCDNALLVKALVTSVKKVSGTARFFFGAFAGKASLTVEVTLIDGRTGTPIGGYQVIGQSGGSGMLGGTGDAVKKTAEAIVKLIGENL